MGNKKQLNNIKQSAAKGKANKAANQSGKQAGNQNNKQKNVKQPDPVEEMRSRKAEERMKRQELRKERNKQKYQTTDKYRRDFHQLLTQLKPLGLTITDAKGDGNCLFRFAFSLAFGGMN